MPPGEEEWLPSYREWQAAGPVLAELETMLEETGAEPVFAVHPFEAGFGRRYWTTRTPHRDLAETLQQALSVLTEVEQLLEKCPLEAAQTGDPDRLRQLVQFAVLLYPLARTGQLALADPDREEAGELRRQMKEYRRLQEVLQHAAERNIHWRDRLEERDVEAALALAVRYEGRFLSGLHGGWRRLKQQVQRRYDWSTAFGKACVCERFGRTESRVCSESRGRALRGSGCKIPGISWTISIRPGGGATTCYSIRRVIRSWTIFWRMPGQRNW